MCCREPSRSTASTTRTSLNSVVAAAGNGKYRPPPMRFGKTKSFHNYADYAASEPFRRGLDRLHALARGRACAVMCAESLWWRCHRRIIADYLLASGERVFHIMGPGQVQKAVITEGVRQDDRGILTYPARTRDALAVTDR